MTAPAKPGSEREELKLPFELRTVLRSIWRQRGLGALIMVVSILGGVFTGLALGSRVYRAETVLHYRPAGGTQERELRTSLNSLREQVKVVPNVQEVKRRLNLDMMLESLGAAIQVDIPRDTTLMIIKAESNLPNRAAAMANTMRDVFLERWFRSLLSSIDTIFEQTKVEKATVDQQVSRVRKALKEIEQRLAQEERAARKSMAANLEYQRLREQIEVERQARINNAELKTLETELERADSLYRRGLMARSDYEEVRGNYEKAAMTAIESDKMSRWKRRLKDLGERIAATQPAGAGSAMVQELLLKAADVEIQSIAVSDKLAVLDQTRRLVRNKLKHLETLQEYGPSGNALQREAEEEMREVQSLLTKARALYDQRATEFELVSEAAAAENPHSSSRKLIAFGVAAIVMLFGLGTLTLRELFTDRIRSTAELAHRVPLSVVGAIPPVPAPDPNDRASTEAVTAIGQAVRSAQFADGARLLVTGVDKGAGATSVAAALAASFGRQNQTAIIVDADLRTASRPPWWSTVFGKVGEMGPGLGSYLSSSASVDESIHRTNLPNVDVVPFDGVPVSPDLLGSRQFGALLDFLGERYTIVIVDTPPAQPNADAGIASRWCDAALLVVRGGGVTSSRLVGRAAQALRTGGVGAIGTILNGAEPYFERH